MLIKVIVIDKFVFPSNKTVQKLLAVPDGAHPVTNNPNAKGRSSSLFNRIFAIENPN